MCDKLAEWALFGKAGKAWPGSDILRTDQARKLKDLEKENARLKRLVADLALDKAMLQEVASGNF
ncbi:MAG: cell division protein FtsB [Phycisphaerales bacterium]